MSGMPGQTAAEEMLDAVFPLLPEGTAHLARDHALPLWRALLRSLPWLADEAAVAVPPLSGLAPCDGGYAVGRRTRLALRLPRRRLTSAEFLVGTQLALAAPLRVGPLSVRALQPARVVHAHCVDMGSADEGEFLARCEAELGRRGLRAQLICGRAQRLAGEAGEIRGFSLLLHGLANADYLHLQARGLGRNAHLGCGVFQPHKDIVAVGGD